MEQAFDPSSLVAVPMGGLREQSYLFDYSFGAAEMGEVKGKHFSGQLEKVP